jgi:hypothetical protein
MASIVTIITKDGAIHNGLSYRLGSGVPWPYAPASPGTVGAGMWYLNTTGGWEDIPNDQVVSITVHPGATT